MAQLPASFAYKTRPDIEQLVNKYITAEDVAASNAANKLPAIATVPSTDIWLQQFWLSHTRMLRDLKMFDRMFQKSPKLKKACQQDMHVIVQICCRKGRQKKHGHTLASFVAGRNKTERVFAALGFLLMLKYESRDGIYAVVERMAMRVVRCESAKKQAYTQVIQKGAHVARKPQRNKGRVTRWDKLLKKALGACMETAEGTFPQCSATKLCSSPTDMAALNRMYEVVEDYLDDHKEKAFKSAMFEPCRFYFDLAENDMGRDHVDTHGLNWFLVMIRGGLGAHLPLIPMDNETDNIGFCDCWSGLHETAWPYFADPANFGKSFEGIKELRRETSSRRQFLRDRSIGEYDDPKTKIRSKGRNGKARKKAHKFAGASCQVLEKRCERGDQAFKPYLDKFRYFFRREFLVRRMFEVLNSENKPEHVGFRKACNTLYAIYRRHTKWAVEDSLLEHMYGEEFVHLDLDRATAFFAWIGVCKPMHEGWIPHRMAASKSTDHTESKASKMPSVEKSKGKNVRRTLADISADLQRAMAARDVPTVKLLMRERRSIVAK